jgi:hydrogenase expression/formation protein HypC
LDKIQNGDEIMCLSIPSKVVKINKDSNMATVDTMGVQRDASLDLMQDDDVTIGDYVLLHIGFIMNKIDEVDALASIDTYKEILELMEEERQANDNCLSFVAPHDDCDMPLAPQDSKDRQKAILKDDECPNKGL